jgi:midasin (ATPase involved in ribosome maturation)
MDGFVSMIDQDRIHPLTIHPFQGSYTKLYLKHDIYNLLNKMKASYNEQLWTDFESKQRFEFVCKKVLEINQLLTEQTETSENFNQDDYQRFIDYIDRNLDNTNPILVALYKDLKTKLEKTAKENVKFDWQNSNLIDAIKNGHWLLIDNANFCNPSVLDRLNPLLEPNGSLVITEQGCVNGELSEIKAHENFRLFLCINETFGELSRAMRNRGLEIYLNQIDLFGGDSINLLRNVFTQNQLESKEFSVDLLLDVINSLNTNENKLNFKSVLKFTKLISDYWLYKGTCFANAVEQAASDMNLKKGNDIKPAHSLEMTKLSYTSNTFKLFKYPIYSHLYKFKYLNEIKQIGSNLNTSALSDLYNYTSLVQIWFENVAIRHRHLIFDYAFNGSIKTASHVSLMNLFKTFFALHDKSSSLNSMSFVNFIENLNGITTSVDLNEQSFDVSTNRALISKLNSIDKGKANHLIKLNAHLHAQLFIYLSKLRMDACRIEYDSLERMNEIEVEKDYSLNLGLIKKFQQDFYRNQIDGFGFDGSFAQHYVDFKTCLIQIENFLVLLKKPFDSNRTIAYLKYYWNFISKSISAFQADSDLQTTVEQLKNHLYFNDFFYNIYLNVWKTFMQQIDFFITDNDGGKMNTLHQFLMDLNSIKLDKNLKSLIKYINFNAEYAHFTNAYSRRDKSIDNLVEIIEKIHKSTNESGVNLNESKLNFIKYEHLPMQSYLDFVRSLEKPTSNLPANLIDCQCSSTCFTRLYRIYMDTCFNYNVFLKLKPILLINDEENFNEFLTKFDMTNTNLVNLNLLQYNWYFEYTNRVLCDFDFKNTQLLNNYNQTLSNFNSIMRTIWSNKSTFDVDINKYLDDFHDKVCLDFDRLLADKSEYLAHKGYSPIFNQLKVGTNVFHRLIGFGIQLSFLYLPMDPLDPYVYENLNTKNFNESLGILQNELDWYFKMSELTSGERGLNSHLSKTVYDYLEKNPKSRSHLTIYRDNDSSYYEIKREFEHILLNICSFDNIKKFLVQFDGQTSSKTVELEYKTWHLTMNNFIKYIAKKYFHYSDIVYPIMSGLGLVVYAINSLYTKWLMDCEARQNAELLGLIQTLLSYPTVNNSNAIGRLIDYVQCLAKSGNGDACNRVYLIALMNLYGSYSDSGTSAELNAHLTRILKHFSDVYQSNLDGKLADQVNTYKYKKYGQAADDVQAVDEVEADNDEIQSMFPSYLVEFNEFEFIKENFERSDKKKPVVEKVENESLNYSIKTFKQVYNLIKLLIRRPEESSSADLNELILFKTFFESYKFGSYLLQTNCLHFKPNSQQDFNLSNMLFTCLLKKFDKNFQLNNDELYLGRTQNIYVDSNFTEIIKCKTLMDQLKLRLVCLLAEFPNNSMLIELEQIIKRIETFNINDTLIKYLTGLELLVKKAQSWQLIAAKQYSLDEELRLISDLIIEWRKLELNYWRQLLTIESENIEQNCGYVWFFHVYTVCLQFKLENSDEIYQAFMHFMSSCPIGEFKSRLNILRMCYELFKRCDEPNARRISDILWNIHKYYEIFGKLVESEIEKSKTSIEKDLHDYIKICRWQDMNYWALKQSIDKSHKTLFKFIKKFRDQMQTDCLPYLNVANLNKSSDVLTIKTSNQLKNSPASIVLPADYDRFYSKMKRFANVMYDVKTTKDFISSLNDLTMTINERFNEFKTSTRTLFKANKETKELKDAYKKNIKNLQLQKSKTLDDLLGLLKFIGLSYRKGICRLPIPGKKSLLNFRVCFKAT